MKVHVWHLVFFDGVIYFPVQYYTQDKHLTRRAIADAWSKTELPKGFLLYSSYLGKQTVAEFSYMPPLAAPVKEDEAEPQLEIDKKDIN